MYDVKLNKALQLKNDRDAIVKALNVLKNIKIEYMLPLRNINTDFLNDSFLLFKTQFNIDCEKQLLVIENEISSLFDRN